MKKAKLFTFQNMYIIEEDNTDRFFIVEHLSYNDCMILKEIIEPRNCDYIIVDTEYQAPKFLREIFNDLDNYLENGVCLIKSKVVQSDTQ